MTTASGSPSVLDLHLPDVAPGAHDYLTKPLDVAGFLETIDAAFAEIEKR